MNFATAESRLRALRDPAAAETAIELMQLAKATGLKPVAGTTAISFRFPIPGAGEDRWLTVFLLADAGTFYVNWTDRWERAGAAPAAAADFLRSLEGALGPVERHPTKAGSAVRLTLVEAHLNEVKIAISRAVKALKAQIGVVPAQQQVIWKLVVHHDNPAGALAWSKETGRIAVGWGSTGDLRSHEPGDAEEIGGLIRGAYPEATNSHIGGPSLWNLYGGMVPGDLVIVVADGLRDHVAEITGDYLWASLEDSFGDYQHQRPVVITDIDANGLWERSGGAAPGQAVRWVVCRCASKAEARRAAGGAGTFSEGSRVEVLATRSERNPEARRACLAHYGFACSVCAMHFEKRYGEIGIKFIHVHHLLQLADAEGEREVDPVKDLRPVCPNCHAMLHTSRPPLKIEELKAALRLT